MPQLSFFESGEHTLALTLPQNPKAIICCVSGGIDSVAAALEMRRRYPATRIILLHNYLERMDWPQTDESILRLSKVIGNCEILYIQAVWALTGALTNGGYNATTLKRLHVVRHNAAWFGPAARQDDNELLTLLEFGERARKGQPPTKKIRWCTGYQKSSPTDKWLQQHPEYRGKDCLLVSGERAAESSGRAALPESEWRFQSRSRNIIWHRPVLSWHWHDAVRLVVDHSASLIHPAYFWQGETLTAMLDPNRDERGRARLSCVRCIFSREEHVAAARQTVPHITQSFDADIARYEARTGYIWHMSGIKKQQA